MQRKFFKAIMATVMVLPFYGNSAADEAVSHGYALSTSIWDKLDIPVCWETLSTSTAADRTRVQFAVKASWELQSKVRFHGWGACTASADGIRIRVSDEGPHVKRLGKGLDGYLNGMVLNFTYANWGSSCAVNETTRQYCNKAIALHEFGHALGFAHEHNRPDTPDLCLDAPQGTNGDIIIGEWDLHSIMNYCNPRYNNDGRLSDTDRETLSYFYGLPDRFALARWATNQGGYPSQMHWVAGDFNGDGIDDIGKIFNDANLASIGLHLSNGAGGFTQVRRATRQGGFSMNQKWMAGDLDGDGRDEIINVFSDGGLASITVHGYKSDGTYGLQRWSTKQGGFSNDQRWMVGDFNGDGKDDLVNVFSDQGKASATVHIAGNNSFTRVRYMTRQGGIWAAQKWFAGDYNGDGKDDLIRIFPHGTNTATIDVLSSDDNTFKVKRWLQQGGFVIPTTTWLAGEYTGDGQFDLISVNRNGFGTVSGHLYEADGIGFANVQYEAIRGQGGYSSGFNWLVGDFNGDGRDDLAKTFRTGNFVSIDVHKSICRDLAEYCR